MKTSIFRLIFLLPCLGSVFADYCVYGLCKDDIQYCCGKNTCCDKTLDLWFFWAAILLVMFIITVTIVTLCRKAKSYSSKYTGYEEVTPYPLNTSKTDII